MSNTPPSKAITGHDDELFSPIRYSYDIFIVSPYRLIVLERASFSDAHPIRMLHEGVFFPVTHMLTPELLVLS
jgi:hypothetical protein